ncbi:class A beta-lactamase, subclass A2 [Empedobacter brevis]|uniref:class A beta-lactamase, subclass A2 n=1 Tax=Empedobacter brevis TaxID=247 RepID=UPI00123E2856|nr:class A beta-lactamase, subclass A2 [Empedobacter brevis]QES91227.1 class A beta-lactamase, subclass A2 [Empedobacter brevis]
MNKLFFSLLFILSNFCLKAQSIERLRTEINQIISSKNLTAGISLKNIENKDTLSINGNQMMPMMSVFKFHIALTVLHEVDQNKLQLDQKFFIKKKDLLPNTWSPILDDFPEGNMYLTLDQLLRYTVSHSDNNGCDILLKIIGGTKIVQNFIHKQGVKDFVIKVNEQEMQKWDNLYINTTSANATAKLLEKFYTNKVLKKNSTTYLYQLMVETSRGSTWMKAGLPANTELAHRTGISDTNSQNLRVAMNDIGIIKLVDGKRIILSIYLKNITEERAETEKVMADITKAVWNYYNK